MSECGEEFPASRINLGWTAPTENGVAEIVSDDFPVRAHEAKSRHAVKHDGSFQKYDQLRLVDSFTDCSEPFAVQVYSVLFVR